MINLNGLHLELNITSKHDFFILIKQHFNSMYNILMDYLIVIPARYESSRFPGKPLKKIKKIPMIIRTAMQCIKAASIDKIIVATDDKRIEEVCREYNIKSIITF